ncbi:beta-N-acetylhexosaminidase [Macrococcus hajekii]|uniref:Beta-N-acetylhexosaminidase n=1 Tax=Macrococcus hajekii TaxID=198482 RepID=A0A4R6BLY3_9STAP|nr:glycoside hydrolase family 3 protein [Macrococcus hajekii]TDM02806.1 beta-N-acetylhexosaminidase [Macrococcus hajekii]GGB04055.1 glycoside hydrolase family 3 [Macrococcus hajekii]
MKKLFLLGCIMLAGCQHAYEPIDRPVTFKYHKLPEFDGTGLEVSQLTLEEKIYQSLILGFDGTVVSPQLSERLSDKLGGVILFNRNITSVAQVQQLNQSISTVQQEIPPFIGVDQEGGRVNRLPAALGNSPSAFTMAQSGDREYVYEQGRWTGQKLKQLHFNLDFSTVLDIWTNPANTVIGDRSFGTTADSVTTYAGAFNEGIQQEGMVTAGKHFPGHGDTFLDSHLALPVSQSDMKRLNEVELVPFIRLKNDMDMMMVSHIVMAKLDNQPSSLSRRVTTELLQDKLGYKGVIITDDMAMGAIANGYSQSEAVIQAFKAGNTMILIGSDIGDADVLVNEVVEAVRRGDIKEEQIDENVQKILRLKTKYDIL